VADINKGSVLAKLIDLGVVQVVSFVETETFFIRHGYVLSLFTYLFGQLRSFWFFGTLLKVSRLHSSLKLSLLNLCFFI
jgi:hypothetical protein